MRRSAVLGLRESQWTNVVGDPALSGLEVCVVPAAGTTFTGSMRDVILTAEEKLHTCRFVFVDFKGYLEDDGKDVTNSLAARLELIDVSYVWTAVLAKVMSVQSEVLLGEADAASD